MTTEAHPRSLSEASGWIFDIPIRSFSLFFQKKITFFHLTDKLLLSTNWFLSIVLTVKDIDRNIIIFISKYVKFNESKHYLPHGEESVFLKQSCRGGGRSWSRESCILPHCCLSDVWQLIPSCFIILSSFKILYVQNTCFSSSFTLSVLQHVPQINITFPCTSWVSWRCRNWRKERPGVGGAATAGWAHNVRLRVLRQTGSWGSHSQEKGTANKSRVDGRETLPFQLQKERRRRPGRQRVLLTGLPGEEQLLPTTGTSGLLHSDYRHKWF